MEFRIEDVSSAARPMEFRTEYVTSVVAPDSLTFLRALQYSGLHFVFQDLLRASVGVTGDPDRQHIACRTSP